MRKLKAFIIQIPLLGNVAIFFYRLMIGLSYALRPLRSLVRWLLHSKETTNFTYALTNLNRLYLAALIAHSLDRPFAEIQRFMLELETDEALKTHIQTITALQTGQPRADTVAHYGRRIGWYAIVRACKPRVIIETGVDKGLGSCVLVAALMRNAQEGSAGHYYGVDINPAAGYLLVGPYAEQGEILYGDSLATLSAFDQVIDLFINDSDHSEQYEEAEYKIVADKLSSNAIVLGDNAHSNDKLLQFALKTERQFVFFREEPANHWYPGGGIGIAFKKAVSTMNRDGTAE